jgi:SAM-dependent MidA family methyltransferase
VLIGVDGERLHELLVEAPGDDVEEADLFAPDAAPGSRIPLQHGATSWVRCAHDSLVRGRIVLVDYADTTPSMATRPWTDWLRTYRQHARGGHPLDAPGEQDITCEVAVDQLARFRSPAADRPQAEWLRANGVDDLAAAARDAWQERAHIGDLEALKARSRAGEADAITDPAGLGAFRVLEWQVD